MPKTFWVSWYQAGDDYRPLSFPPNAAILGWWCSGFTSEDDTRAILVAMVAAEDQAKVADAICQDWPEFDGEFRFCDEMFAIGKLSDRFPLSDWMRPRIEAHLKA